MKKTLARIFLLLCMMLVCMAAWAQSASAIVLSPFNHNTTNQNDRPTFYDNMTLNGANNSERIVVNVNSGSSITLPSHSALQSGFTINGNTYSVTNLDRAPQDWKLVGWYDVITGKYYDVTDGPKTVTIENTNSVFYADWQLASYDLKPSNTKGTFIDTVDTSAFIDIRLFDYNELFNRYSTGAPGINNGNESWSNTDRSDDGFLLFNDYATYDGRDGAIGRPHNLGSANNPNANTYTENNTNPGILGSGNTLNKDIIDVMFSPSDNYVGKNYIGKGNYLFTYDPDTGMYVYNSHKNGAVYQQSEERFYVYDSPTLYRGSYPEIDTETFLPLTLHTDEYDGGKRYYKANGEANFWFGMSIGVDFFLPDNSGSGGNKINDQPMIYEFTGDDDMWVVIDGKVVLDIGGVHNPLNGSIDFSTGKVTVNGRTYDYDFEAGNHRMEIYYLERGGDLSNCDMKFNLLPKYEAAEVGLDVVSVNKTWDTDEGIKKPNDITVELLKDGTVVNSATLAESNNWHHTFGNLTKGSYSVREVDSNLFYEVITESKTETISNCWVFTDAANLKDNPKIWIGCDHGSVLSSVDCSSVNVQNMNADANVIIEMTGNSAQDNAMAWTVEMASNSGGQHFYLKNANGQYLDISGQIRTVSNKSDASLLYINASGDLQDADSTHRLVHTDSGFGTSDKKPGNETNLSNNRVSVYRQTTQETAVYTYKLTNKFVNPAIQLLKTDDSGNHLPGATLKLTGPDGYAVEWESGNTAELFPVTQAEYYKQEPWLKLSEGDKKYVYTFTETRAPQGYQKSDEQLKFYVKLNDEGRLCVVDTNDDKVISEYIYDKDRQTWTLVSGTAHLTLFNSCATGNLQISKTIVSDTIDTTKEFPFTVIFANSTHALAKTYIYKIGDQAYELELTNGKGTLYLKHGQTALFEGLPVGTTYTIEESVPTGYTVSPESASGSINENQTATAAFTNTQTPGSLEISKTIEGGPSGKTFDFIVELSHDDISLTADHRTYTINGTEYTLGADNKITLGHGQKAIFSNLPVGTEYKVTEVQDNGYIQVAPPKDHPTAEGTVTEGSLVQTAPFVNTEISLIPALVVRKTVAGNASSTDDAFDFVVKFWTDEGKATPVTKDLRFAYSYDEVTAGFRTLAYDSEKGGYPITLKHGQKATLVSLTKGWAYEVVELDNVESYICTSGTTKSGVMPEVSAEAAFHNEKNTLSLVKTVSGLSEGDTAAPTVVIKNTANETVFEGTLTPTIVQTLTLPSGTYTLTESGCDMSEDGYDWAMAELTGSCLTTASGAKDTDSASFTFTIPENASAAMALTLNNIYTVKTNDLSITKTIEDAGNIDEAAQSTRFDFTITLSNDHHALSETGYACTITNAGGEELRTGMLTLTKGSDGKYTGMIQLGHGETAVIENLPVDTVYKVAESDKTGFTLTGKTGDEGTITADGQHAAAFINTRDAILIRKIALDQNGDPLAVTVEALFTTKDSDTTTSKRLIAGADYATLYLTEGSYVVDEREGTCAIAGYQHISAALTDEAGNKLDMNSANLVSGGRYTLTNTYAQGSLELTKTVSNNPVPDYEFEFTIDLKFKNAALSGDYLAYEITGSEGNKTTGTLGADGKITLKHGETITFPKLPIGTAYTITEAEDVKYSQISPEGAATGTIKDTKRVSVEFTNSSFFPTLSVEKTVTGNDASTDDSFDFLVKLADGETAITRDLAYMLGTDDEVKTMTYDSEKDGYALSLKHGQKITFISLTPGWTYSVKELDANTDNYTLVSDEVQSGTLPQTTAETAFINSRNAVNIEKKAIGLSGDDTVSPEFSVDGTSIGNLTSGGEAYKLYVTPGQSYTVTETGTDVEGYTFLSAEISATDNLAVSNTDGMGFTFPADGMTAIPTVTVTNRYDPVRAGLSISKTVVGDEDAKAQAFTFTVKLTNDKHTLAEKYSYTVNSGAAQDLLLTDGVGTITLTDGQTATLTGLPLGTVYEVTETHVDGFTADPADAVTGTIVNTTDAYRADFTNTRTAIKVKKVTEGLAASDVPAKITAAFTGSESASVELAPNAADFTSLYLTPGTYAVTESGHEVAGYELVSSVLTDKEGKELDMTAAALVNGGEYTITNTYEPQKAGLSISKKVEGDEDAKKQAFTFTVKLTNDKHTLANTYSYTVSGGDAQDLLLTDGVGTITLTDGQTATLTGLPLGTAYEVTETAVDGFTLTSKSGDTGTITDKDGSYSASFTNTRTQIMLRKITSGLHESDIPETITVTLTGKDTATQTLAPNEDFVSLPLTPGTYNLFESGHEVPGYTLAPPTLTDEAGNTLPMNAAALVNGGKYTITNNYTQGSMTLSKSVTNSTGDPKFLFDIVFSLNGEPLDERYQVYTLNGVDGAFTGSRLQVTLGDKDSIVFPLLPIGAAYTITETPDTGYQQVSPQGGQSASGVIGVNGDNQTVTFINTEISLIPALVVEKTVSGNASSTSDEFDFVVSFWTDENKTTPVTQDLRFTYSTDKATDGFRTLSYDAAKGGYPITLKHTEHATFVSLTEGWFYEVTEADNGKDYALTGTVNANGTIPKVSVKASFHNEKNELTLVKKVSGLAQGDSISPSVQIKNKDGETVYTGTLTPDTAETLILPAGTYTLTESGCNMSDAGYDWMSAVLTGSGLNPASTGEKGTDNASFTFTVPDNATGTMALQLDNTYAVKLGGLIISKKIEGDEAAQAQRFTFTVKLTNAKHAVTPSYSVNGGASQTLTLTDGTGTIELGHNDTATLTGLPLGTAYEVTETAVDGFTADPNAAVTGTITAEDGEYRADFTNTRTAIKVKKVTEGLAASDVPAKITAAFTGSESASVELVPNAADFTSLYLTPGTYAVTESGHEVAGYELVSSVLTDKEGKELDMTAAALTNGGEYTLTNKYAQGSLALTKTVQGAAPDYGFDFTIDLKFGGAALTGDYLAYEITGSEGNKTTGTLGADGKITLKHGETITFPTLPIGTAYTITEAADVKYSQISPEGAATGTIKDTKRVSVEFTNSSYYPTLSVEKTVTGNDASADDSFDFLVKLADGETAITRDLAYMLGTDDEVKTMTYDSEKGGYALSLKHGQKITFISLTPGWTYSVKELDANTDNYTLVSDEVQSGTLPQTTAETAFINSRNAVNIEKKAIGLSGDDTVSPEFSVDGTSIGNLTSGGEAYKLYVTPGQSYAVTETGTDVEGYTFLSAEISATDNLAVSNTDGMGFTFPADGMAAIPTVTVTNKYDPIRAGLSISKTVVGDEDAKAQAFTFTVKLTNDKHTLADKYSYTVNGGDAQDLVLIGGVGTITLTDGQTATLTGLPLGTAYEVTETAVDGFTLTAKSGDTGTITDKDGSYSASFTNTRTQIMLRKITSGLHESDIPETITVTLTGKDTATQTLAPNKDFVTLPLTPGTYNLAESGHEVPGYTLAPPTLTDEAGNTLPMNAAALVNGGEYTITNTYKQGSMTLSKSVTNSTGDPEFLFDIVFSLNGEALDERYQVYTLNGVDGAFTGSRLQVTLGDLDSIVFPLLPIGTAYTITETPDTGYQQVSPQGGQSASGVIGENSDDHTVTFVNTEVSLIPALVVEKTVSGNASSTSDEFDFVVRFWTDETKTTPVTQNLRYAYSTTPATDGFSAISYDETAGGYPITLRHGQLAPFVSLTQGWAYEVWENDNALGYTLVSANPASGLMPEVSASASFHNVKNELTLVKKVTGLDEGDSVSPSVEITDKAGKTVFSGVLTPDKIETLSLIPGDYTLTESGCDMTGMGYDWTSATLSGLNAEIASKDGGKAAFTFTVPENASGAMALQLDNVYAVKRGGLVIRKTLENAGDDATAFTFTLTLSNDSHPLDAAGYPCTIYNADGTVSGTQRVAAGSTIMLSHGQYAMIENLPVSTQYAVAESAQSGYTLVSKDGESGVIADTESSYTAAFVNRRTAIRIQKTVSGENADALTTPVTVTFTKVGETQPAATVTLTPGAGYTDMDLPEGMYTITESGHSVAGYLCQTTFTVDGSGSVQAMTGNEAAVSIGSVQVADGASYTIDNSYADGELALSKKIIGGTDGKRFTFTVEFSHDSVTLTDKHLTYTLNGQTLVLPANGTLTLGHGETAVFPNLPIGTAYTITETQDSGYQQVSPSGGQAATGTITGSESVQAAFVNTAVALIPAIVVEKTVGGNAADTQDAFDFVVRFSDGGETVTQDLRYALSTDAPEDGFRTLRYDADKGGYPVTLRHGEKATIVSLTEGWTYAVIEDEAAAAAKGYALASSENAKGTVPEISETASFINERNLVKIRKVTDGLPAGTTVSPTITVGGKTIGTLTSDTEETLSVYVARGESYALTESGFDAAGFDFSGASISATDGLEVTGADGSFTFAFPAGGLDVVPTVTLTNAYTSDLIIEKQIEHGAYSGEAIFPIRISLSHAEKTLADAYPYTTSKGTSGMLVLDGGSGEIGLTGGETATLTGLPYGTVFSLTEGATEGFAQVSAQGTDGSIAAKGQQKAVFVNKPIDRSLSITKKLAGNAADSADSFTFTVMLTGADGSALAGSYPVSIAGTASGSITSGGTITLTGGQTAIIADLPDGTVFTVTESDPTAKHYVLSLGDEANSDETATADGLGLTGLIRRENEDVVFTNERNAVRIRKIATGLLGTDTVSPTVSVDGEAIGQLVSGGDSALVYLVPGTHALAESGYDAEGYDFIASSVTGSAGVQAEKTSDAFSFTLESGLTTIPQVTIHNEYAVKTDSLSIRKEIAGNAASADDVFTFDITLTRGGQSVTGSFTMQILQGEAAVRTAEFFADASGKATLTLTGGQKAIITGLPLGTAYTVTEQPAEGYVLTSAEGAQGTIDGEAACEASFLNTKDIFSTLTVIKTIVGSSPSTSDSFTFTVTLTDPDGKPVSGEFACAGLNVPSLDFDRKGEARFTLSHGQSVVISGLPYGTAYTVKEKEHRDYEMTHSTGASGVIDADGETASFQNTHAGDLPSLTLSKAVEGNAASAEDSFSFTITMTDKDGKPLTGTWTCSLMTASGAVNGVLQLDENGSAVIGLKADESFTIMKLPVGASYTVTETIDPALGYTASQPSFSGVIENQSTNASAPFVNTKHTALTIRKTASSNPALTAYPAPTVSLYKADSSGNKTGDALATVQLEANGEAVALDAKLETGALYLIEESGHTVEDYDVQAALIVNGTPANGMTFTAQGGEQSIALVLDNVYTSLVGPLTITKTVRSAEGENAAFEFTVELQDAQGNALEGSYPYEGTLDGTQAISGAIASGESITLMGGGSVTIGRLPLGTVYTVTEREDAAFKPESAAASGTIDIDGETAAFVNAYYDILPALKVEKRVQGNASSTEDTFRFTVTLTDKTSGEALTGQISMLDKHGEAATVALDENGSVSFELAHGESVTFIKLPVNTAYTVSEERGSYVLVSSENAQGAIIGEQDFASTLFINERNAEAAIAKAASGIASGEYPAPTVSIYREGDMSTPLWTGTLEANGAAAQIGPMAQGSYVLVESGADVDGYSCAAALSVNGETLTGDPASGVPFTVKESETALTLLVTNVYEALHVTFSIAKIASGLPEMLTYPAPTVSIYAAQDMTAPVLTLELAPNGDAQTLSLAPGDYVLREQGQTVADYSCASVLYVNGTVSIDNTFTITPAMTELALVVENTYAAEFALLTLSKTVTGEGAAYGDDFTFIVTLTDAEGNALESSYPYEGTLDGTQEIRGTVASGAAVTLRHGGSITVKLPLDARYAITEELTEGYILVSSEGSEGVITPANASAAFVNRREFSVTVRKQWFGDKPENRPKSVRIQLLLDGKPYGEPVTLNEACGWAHTFTGLEVSGPYAVEELSIPKGYVCRIEETEENSFLISNLIISIPQTGDTSASPMLYAAMLAVSGALLALLLRKKRA